MQPTVLATSMALHPGMGSEGVGEAHLLEAAATAAVPDQDIVVVVVGATVPAAAQVHVEG